MLIIFGYLNNYLLMKNFKLITLLFAFCLLGCISMHAQDYIILKDDTKIKCIVTEVGEDQVKYKPWGSATERIIAIDRSIVRKIKYEGGDPDIQNKDAIETNYFWDDTRHAIKLGFSGLLGNGLTLAYEKAIDPRSSLEFVGRVQNIGMRQKSRITTTGGFGLGLGYRLQLTSSTRKAAKQSHILYGWYVKPELFFMNVTARELYIFSGISDDYNINFSKLGLMLNLGKEIVLNNRFVLEFFGGFGLAATLSKSTSSNQTVCIDCISDLDLTIGTIGGEYLALPSEAIAYGVGLRLGYAFHAKKPKK
jgi:hypothetical protein